MKSTVLVVLLGFAGLRTAAAADPVSCRPLRPAPIAPAAAVEMRSLPQVPLEEPQPQAPLDEPQPVTPGMVTEPTSPAAPAAGGYGIQRVAPEPWASMKCIPPAPCRTPCYADCIPCEARMFRNTAPKCHGQAMHLSLRDAVWNALDLPHALHESCRKVHNTYFTPNPYARPWPYERGCD